MGQSLPGTDAKVFEVLVRLGYADEILRPAMTTINFIVTDSHSQVHFVPLVALHEEAGIPYVYKSDDTKQIVVPGATDGNNIIIEHGLEEGELVHLSVPEGDKNFVFAGNELIAETKADY